MDADHKDLPAGGPRLLPMDPTGLQDRSDPERGSLSKHRPYYIEPAAGQPWLPGEREKADKLEAVLAANPWRVFRFKPSRPGSTFPEPE